MEAFTLQPYVNQAVNMARLAHSNPKEYRGLNTGIPSVNKIAGGLPKGELTIVAALSSVGKSAFAFGVGFDIARNVPGSKVLMVSLEMSMDKIVTRETCRQARIPLSNIYDGPTQSELEKFADTSLAVAQLPVIVAPKSITTINGIMALLNRIEGVTVLVIDYLQLLAPGGGEGLRHEDLANIAHALQQEAEARNIAIMAIAQLKRTAEEKDKKGVIRYPMKSDIEGSQGIEKSADNLWYLHNPAYHEIQEYDVDQRELELIIEKARNGRGAGRKIKLLFDSSTMRFSDG